jgi:hypothetical protein
MEFVQQAAIRSVGGYDRGVVLGYAAFALVALAAVYFASVGPASAKPNAQSQQYYLDK